LLTARSSVPSVLSAISSRLVEPPVLMVAFKTRTRGIRDVEHLERTVAVTRVKPSAVRHNAIWSRMVVIHGTFAVENNPDESACPADQCVRSSRDDIHRSLITPKPIGSKEPMSL
jgi:hypothetical protein